MPVLADQNQPPAGGRSDGDRRGVLDDVDPVRGSIVVANAIHAHVEDLPLEDQLRINRLPFGIHGVNLAERASRAS